MLVFASASDTQQYLEAIDVEDGVYPAAYGPGGEAYSITSHEGLVFVERIDEPNRPDDLHRLLLNCLEATGRLPVGSVSLDELVATVWAVKGGDANVG
ncbi:hypothetical protein M0208_02560 [Sphingomonas sp. SUN019]|uniref:hypothetical protein n=1 Tax=Sphingomonas sp. SUN019 TaxID=2937788 RepID=UPI002164E967|nr:hypothetical protein [Sphingomonas sp. SUN019]UVO49446.1 hypothetical protein M0208_02560 [Sphingomonas sp. SUN019]